MGVISLGYRSGSVSTLKSVRSAEKVRAIKRTFTPSHSDSDLSEYQDLVLLMRNDRLEEPPTAATSKVVGLFKNHRK